MTVRVSGPRGRPSKNKRAWFLQVCFLALLLSGFSGAAGVAQDTLVLVGSGSSVPAPLYNRWAQEYAKHKATIQLRYVPNGTSEGIKQIAHGAGDFSAGEARLSEEQRKDGGLIELPAVLIAIVPIYNLPEVHQQLRLSGEVLAQIFMGDIRKWNAPAIAKLNPEAVLPDLSIAVVNRPGGKGSNYVFTDFLAKVSAKFRSGIGVTASPKWPVGVPAERSSDMVEKVKGRAGSLGFVELRYADNSKVATAAVLNAAGKYVTANAASIAAACAAVEEPRWSSFSASLTNASGADSFPIASFTWIYLRTESPDSSRTAALRDLLDWIYSDGQQFVSQEGYAELPAPLVAAARKKVKDLR